MDKSLVGLEITLVGGRSFLVWDKDIQESQEEWMKTCERTGQFIYRVNGLRSWTHNGEAIAEDVLKTLIAGAVKVEAFESEKLDPIVPPSPVTCENTLSEAMGIRNWAAWVDVHGWQPPMPSPNTRLY